MKFDHYVIGEINMEGAKELCSQFLSRETKKNVSIFLSSSGGDVDGALSMGSALQSIQRQGFLVHIHVGAVAHSAAVLLLQFANHRTMEAYATLRIHPMYMTYEETTMTVSDLNGEHASLAHAHYTYYDVLQRRSGRDIESLFAQQSHLAQDILLHPHHCLEWNLIDEILEYSFPEAPTISDPDNSPVVAAGSHIALPSSPGGPQKRRASSGRRTKKA